MDLHHPTLSPSSFPKLDLCACFAPDQDSDLERKDRGTVRHRYLSALFGKCEKPEIDTAEAQAVEWFADYIKATATDEEPIDFECTLSLTDDDFNEITFGTPDAAGGPDLWDLKWFDIDCEAQMAVYALMRMQKTGRKSINVHVGFAESRRIQKFTLTEASAGAIVARVLAKATAPDRQPTPSDACGWCAYRLTCSALNNLALSVAAGQGIEIYDPTQIKSPLEMAKARLAWHFLKAWGEKVEKESNKMAAAGHKFPFFKYQHREGNRYFADISLAHQQLGLPTEKFLQKVTMPFGAAVELYRQHHELSSDDAAEKAIQEKCGDNIKRADPSDFLTKERTKKKK